VNPPPHPRDLAQRLATTARTQHMLFTRAQARAAGYSYHRTRQRICAGAWTPVLGPVLAPADIPITAALRDRALVLALPTAVLAGPSAARAHRIPVPDTGQYFLLRTGKRRALAGTRLLRGTPPTVDITTVDRLPVTTAARTVFDCLRLLPDPDAAELLTTALRHGWTNWTDFTTRTQQWASASRPGAARLAALTGNGPTGPTPIPPAGNVPPWPGGMACARCGCPCIPTTGGSADAVTLTLVRLSPWPAVVPAHAGGGEPA